MRNHRTNTPQQWEHLVQEILQDFGGVCACCQLPKPSGGEEDGLKVHHIDGNVQNNQKENLIALCESCQAHLQQDALQHFDSTFIQPPLIEGYDYLTNMQRLRKKRLQQQHFKNLQEALKQAMLRINQKQNKQLKLFDLPTEEPISKEPHEIHL